MIYNDFGDIKLSALGLGTMRLPTVGGEWDAPIDEAEVGKMVDYAIAQGVNYFDTAWGYHSGQSEVVIGRALAKHPRDTWYLANKFPGYDLANFGKAEPIFEEQLKRCGVEYFDFYLFHNVCEMNIESYMDEETYGTYEYLVKQHEAGRIKHLGFSAHGSYDVMKRFLDAYGEKLEFGQIQLNYLDWTFQKAKDKIELLDEYHLPVWVMEPMRGGQLAALPDEDAAILKALRPDETVPAWALRFQQSLPGVTLSLSGASSYEQIRENITSYKERKPLNKAEMDALQGIADRIMKRTALPCTACRYCADHCPQGLDIPMLIGLYNEHCSTVSGFIAPMAVAALPEGKRPGACAACKSCEAVCPQQIRISEAMADFVTKLN